MSVTNELPVTSFDPHTALSEKLGITREAAKEVNYALSYRSKSLVVERGTAFDILRCYNIAAIWFGPWSSSKSAKWAWLTQDQPFDERVAINVIKKFLPDPRNIYEHHTLERHLNIRQRLTKAQEIINKATDEKALPEIELLLRPVAHILTNEGHSIWQ